MKNLLFTLIALVGFATVSFSQTQERGTVANSAGKAELMSSKVSGVYNFTMPSNVTEEMVEKNATYYTQYYSVDFDNATKNVKMTLVENTQQSRYVLTRFLASCGVHQIEVDGENLDIHSFMETYLN